MEDIGYNIVRAVQESREVLEYIARRRFALFSRLHEIVFYGKGGYDLDTVYNLPIWLRKFIYHQINEHYKEASAAAEGKTSQTPSQNSPAPVKGPGVVPRKADAVSKRSTRK